MTRVMIPNFCAFSTGRKKVLARREWAEAIAAALLEGRGCTSAGEGGRGALLKFSFEGGTGLIRTYRRGGFIRHFLKESYVLHNRPMRELRLHAFLYDQGFPVPLPLGICWERHGVCYRGALATQQIDAVDLLVYLQTHPDKSELTAKECGALIRKMHELGVYHADLQVRNILVGKKGIFLIDFDNALLKKQLSPLQRARNLFRLRRSIEKNGLPMKLFGCVCEGYGADALPEWVGRIYHAKGRFSDFAAGRHHEMPAGEQRPHDE